MTNRQKQPLSLVLAFVALLFVGACGGRGGRGGSEHEGAADSLAALELVKPRYATGYTVSDSAGVRLVDVGEHYRFALVRGGVDVFNCKLRIDNRQLLTGTEHLLITLCGCETNGASN